MANLDLLFEIGDLFQEADEHYVEVDFEGE